MIASAPPSEVKLGIMSVNFIVNTPTWTAGTGGDQYTAAAIMAIDEINRFISSCFAIVYLFQVIFE